MVISDQNNKIGLFSLFRCQIQLVYDAVVVFAVTPARTRRVLTMPRSFKDRKYFLKQESVDEVPVVVILSIYNQCAWRENLNSQSILGLPVSVDFAVDFNNPVNL